MISYNFYSRYYSVVYQTLLVEALEVSAGDQCGETFHLQIPRH